MSTIAQDSTTTATITAQQQNPVNEYHKELQQKLSNDALLQGFRNRRRNHKTGW